MTDASNCQVPGPRQPANVTSPFVSIAGRQMYLWRAVDDEGEILDVLVQARRDKDAALRLVRKLLKNQGLVPTSIVTDRYRAYDAAFCDLGLSSRHLRGKRLMSSGLQFSPKVGFENSLIDVPFGSFRRG